MIDVADLIVGGGTCATGRAGCRSKPIARMGQPGEIAEAVAWLLSDAASFVTGCAMPVDGGLTAQ